MFTARSITTLLAALLTPSALLAQSPDTTKARFTIGSSQTMLGYMRLSFPELDARFAAAGLPRVASSGATVGVGADIRRGRALFGASLQSLLAPNHKNHSYRTSTSGSYALFDAGFRVARLGRMAFYPIAGVGVTHLSLNVRERGDLSFDEALATPLREMTISGTSAVAHAALLIEQRFERNGSEFGLDLRVGITRSIGSQTWMSAEDRVSGGPDEVRGSYVRVAFSKPLRKRRDAAIPIAGAAVQAVRR